MSSLSVHNVVKQFGGNVALDGVSLSFAKGNITGIIGPNGSGKSTLTNLITGMMPLQGGTVVVQGRHFTHMDATMIRSLGVTRTFQEVRLFEQMTVEENLLAIFARRSPWRSLVQRFSRGERQAVTDALGQVGLVDKRRALVRTLSYGQRKLVEIIRATLSGTSIFLFDEPFAGLSPAMTETVSGLFRVLKETGKTVILIEHNMQLIRDLCDLVYVLDSGTILAHGKPAHVLAEKAVVEAYLGE